MLVPFGVASPVSGVQQDLFLGPPSTPPPPPYLPHVPAIYNRVLFQIQFAMAGSIPQCQVLSPDDLVQCTLHVALKPDNVTSSSARNQASHPYNLVSIGKTLLPAGVGGSTGSWRFTKPHADWCLLERHLRDCNSILFAVAYVSWLLRNFISVSCCPFALRLGGYDKT